MTNKQKIKVYKRIISIIQNNSNRSNFVCTLLSAISRHKFNICISNCVQSCFEEFFLFKNNRYKDIDWLDWQMKYADTDIVNERRIFICQLCIEMLKSSS